MSSERPPVRLVEIVSTTPFLKRLYKGDRVRFAGERRRYEVMAANERFAVCTKPFAALRTSIYTIVDFQRGVRGREDLIFCAGFETQEECGAALARLVAGESSVSYRHYEPLDIFSVTRHNVGELQ